MKSVFVIFATFLAFAAHAEDHKVGNVIAVQRDISDVYTSCISNIQGDPSKDAPFFSCMLKITKSANEVMISKGGTIRYKDPTCWADADLGPGGLMVTISRVDGTNMTFAQAKTCLQKATASNNTISAVVYTVEAL